MARYYVEQDGNGPYICETGHGRVATIELRSFKTNGGSEDWKLARAIADALNGESQLLKALEQFVTFTAEAYALWGADKDHAVGKLILSLCGNMPGYRPDVDAIHQLIQERKA